MYNGRDLTLVCLYGDNQSSLNLAENPEFHQRTKYINVKHHFIQKHVTKGTIDLYYILTAEIAADGLTKPLVVVKHAEFVKQLRIEVVVV
jgi:hypothetical protein